ncbi:MAG: hypothetical protein WA702_17690 [Bradyrhizobium sp.]|jgi:hypothetical protein|uniref:hypothetical protein n=1 Tax=Bradyrhizobium sp. TaxID=376 RepID=UPI003C7C010E
MAAAAWRRYGFLSVVFSPFLITSISVMVWPESVTDAGWIAWLTIAFYCPIADRHVAGMACRLPSPGCLV